MTQTKNEGFVSHHLKILWWSEQLNSLFQLPYAIWWQWTGVGAYWNLTPTVDPLYMMRYWSGSVNSDALVQSKMWYALLLAVFSCFSEGGIFTVKGGGHIYGNNFYRKYAPPQKFSYQNWQIYVIFLHLKCHFFCDINKLPNLHDHFKISPNKILRKYRENFFRNYAPFFIQRGGIITEITVQVMWL